MLHPCETATIMRIVLQPPPDPTSPPPIPVSQAAELQSPSWPAHPAARLQGLPAQPLSGPVGLPCEPTGPRSAAGLEAAESQRAGQSPAKHPAAEKLVPMRPEASNSGDVGAPAGQDEAGLVGSCRLQRPAAYMLAWLSLVAPPLGLRLPACLLGHMRGDLDLVCSA